MESAEYCNKMREFHESLLLFIESHDENDGNLKKFLQICNFFQISQNPNKLKRLFLLLSAIAENHFRSPDFFTKIEQILMNFESNIKQNFTHDEIFTIFQNNKRIILLLLETKILTETFIINTIALMDNYLKRDELYLYFFQNIKQNLSHRKQKFIGRKYKKIASNYETIRNLSENESYICTIIRNDLVEDFVSYTTRFNIPLSSQIRPTLFETNSFLLKKEPTLIEYATFFGSIQIFKYLLFNNIVLTPSLWLYAIHSNNGEIIHLLEELNIKPEDKKKLLIESIKCHHNSITNYILDTIFYNESYKYIETCFEYYNYSILPKEIDEEMLYNLINYNYDDLVKLLIKERIFNSDTKIHANLMNYLLYLYIYIYFNKSILYVLYEKGKIEMVNALLSYDNEIRTECFKDCTSMKTFFIPQTITLIGRSAFSCCSNLTHISIPNSVTLIGDKAFWFCESLIQITIPSSVTSIGESSFVNCTKLKEINIPSSVLSIGKNAFKCCYSLINASILSSLSSIKENTFDSCFKLINIIIPSSVTLIEKKSFCRMLFIETSRYSFIFKINSRLCIL